MKFTSAQQLLDYMVSNGLGFAMDTKKMALNSCALFLEQLKPAEEIEYAFIATVKPEKMDEIMGAIWGITNQRLLIAKRKILGDYTQSISLEHINDVSMNNSGIGKLGLGKITIDTIRENITATTNIRYADTIYSGLQKIIEQKRLAFTETPKSNAGASHTIEKSVAEQIMEFKQLLDLNIITQEEFEAKKKQLLGL